MQIAGAHVLLTGASRGIGAALATELVARGAELTLVARPSAALTAVAASTGGRALPCDLAAPAERADLVGRASAAGGPVDVLINAAGVDAVGSTMTMSAAAMASLLEVNLAAPAELCRQALPGMLARGRGRLVNVSSGFSTITSPGLTTYCASKAGLSHFTGGLAAELRGTPVGTTLVELGPVRTEMYGDILRDRLAGASLRRFLALRAAAVVTPEAVAVAVCEAVASDSAHVVLPRRMVPVMAFTWLPRRAAALLLTGVPRR